MLFIFIILLVVVLNATFHYTPENSFREVKYLGKHIRTTTPGFLVVTPFIVSVSKAIKKDNEIKTAISLLGNNEKNITLYITYKYSVTNHYDFIYSQSSDTSILDILSHTMQQSTVDIDYSDVYASASSILELTKERIAQEVKPYGITTTKILLTNITTPESSIELSRIITSKEDDLEECVIDTSEY
jgi:regulator of protease activity HflC (stomatin/prohibitin superfamily)